MTNEKVDGMCLACKGLGKVKRKGKETTCPICKGKGHVKFEIASQEEIEYNSYFVERIMDAIETVLGISGAFITDESEIGHFPIEDGDLEKLSEELGIPVKDDDRIVELAKKLK